MASRSEGDWQRKPIAKQAGEGHGGMEYGS